MLKLIAFCDIFILELANDMFDAAVDVVSLSELLEAIKRLGSLTHSLIYFKSVLKCY
jgi:hypothetical protein